MTNSFDLSYMTFIAIQAALKAGDIIKKGFGTTYEIATKPGRQNYVTEYDKQSEACIISLIKHHFPAHAFLAEESGLSHQEFQDTILWIIDPLDGTTNFAHHLPIFTISIAAYLRNEGLCGVIFQPLSNELFIAEKDKGAYLNGTKLTVSTTHQLEDALIGGGLSYDSPGNSVLGAKQLAHLAELGVTLRNLGSAALALAYVAAGKLDGFWMSSLYPWDWAAGHLLIQEAGGLITSYQDPSHPFEMPSSVLATNPLLHQSLLEAIHELK